MGDSLYMRLITTEHIVIACILGMFIRDMVIEFKPKQKEKDRYENVHFEK